jgi:dTDP-4-dehydrorhamnose reductase
MKALILGAGGQVGRALDATLFALYRQALDIRDASSVSRALTEIEPDVPFNAAAYTAVDGAESDADAAFALNRDAVQVIAEATECAGVRLVHLSTDFVFDGSRATPYPPDCDPSPISVYGRSKAEGEAAALEARGSLVVRTAWVYATNLRNFAPTMLRLMCERPELHVVTDQIGSPTHAGSLARALWQLVAAGATGMVHYTDAGVASWYDFAIAIAEDARELELVSKMPRIMPISTLDYPTAARRPACVVLDKFATWAKLGHPAAHWRSELRAMLTQVVAERG